MPTQTYHISRKLCTQKYRMEIPIYNLGECIPWVTSPKIITDLSETYHSNAEESLANHNDLKSYRLLTHCSALIVKYIISKKGHLDLSHVHHPTGCFGVCRFVRFFSNSLTLTGSEITTPMASSEGNTRVITRKFQVKQNSTILYLSKYQLVFFKA